MAASSRTSFFAEFPDFVPDPSARITDEFARLASHRNWKFGSKNYKRQWNRCMRAEFQTAFSNTDLSRLQSWQNLCHELGLQAGPSITQCKKILSRVNVNLVDLLECRKTGERPRMFPSVTALRKYTSDTGRYFPLDDVKKQGLIKIFLKDMI